MLAQPAHARLCRSGMGTVIRLVAGIRIGGWAEGPAKAQEQQSQQSTPQTICETGMVTVCAFLIGANSDCMKLSEMNDADAAPSNAIQTCLFLSSSSFVWI